MEPTKRKFIMTIDKCMKCECTDIDSGWILSAGKVAYKSDDLRYPLEGGNVRSYVCLKCGYMESYVSDDYLKRIKNSTTK